MKDNGLNTSRINTKSEYPALTVKEIKMEIYSHLNLEKGLLYTFLNMLSEPEEIVNTYLYENRRKVQNPFRYLFISVAFSTVIILANPTFRKFLRNVQESSRANYEELEKLTGLPMFEKFQQAQEIYLSYQNIVILISIPVISWITWGVFGKQKFNYAENMAINCFVFGTTYWLSGLAGLLTYFIEDLSGMYLTSILTILVASYLYYRIFKAGIIKSFFTLILAYLPFLFMGIIFQFLVFGVLLML